MTGGYGTGIKPFQLRGVCVCVQALEEMNGKELEGETVEIVFAKPPDQKRKERKAQRQAAKTQM